METRKSKTEFRIKQHVSRLSGTEYVQKTGKIVKGLSLPSKEVPCKCKMSCKTLSHSWRKQLYNGYHNLKSENEQGTYALGFISLKHVERRRNGKYNDPKESKRQFSVKYRLPTTTGNTVEVCKIVFMEILGIKHRFLQTLQSRKKNGISMYEDHRGKYKRTSKFSEADRDLVISDINLYPRDLSHYGRGKSSKEYLSPDLSIDRIHKAFIKKHSDSVVTYKYYRKIFKSFTPKLSFSQPRVDTCSDCDKLNCRIKANTPDSTRASIILQTHHRAYRRALSEMNNDHAEAKHPECDALVLSMDLQQVIQLPSLSHTEMYYSRQLNFYNFGVHVGNNDSAFCCIWHEGQASRGSNEMASCLLKLINSSRLLQKPKLILWSDNCAGQNKNRTMLFLMIWLVSNGLFQEIRQKFLLKGHSFLTCDRDFGHIEKRKRKQLICTPNDLCHIISTAKFIHPLSPVQLHTNNFFNIKQAADTLIDTKNIPISKTCIIKITAENPTNVAYKNHFIDFEEWKYCNVIKKAKTISDIKAVQFEVVSAPGVAQNKLKDVQKMLPYLKDADKQYYNNIISGDMDSLEI